ncbi:c-type cytochrome [Chitinophaga pollutisoli]|uniref:C-type cytochrome n=1 Tax=Chitinophaga pollutisoli TaxID=3133966 RepID=A0ABZ2YUH9_9BACT
MNASQWIELTHPVALFLLCTATGLLFIIILLANTVISSMDVYRDKHLKKDNLTQSFFPLILVPGLADDMFFTLTAVVVLEVLVILVLLALLRFMTGIRISYKAWATTLILFGVFGFVLANTLGERPLPPTTIAEATAPAPERKIDPANVPELTDAADLEAGKRIFARRCAVCHGGAGKGTIGPNLTDGEWLHGGSANEIFHTIKNGVPSKGMQAWEKVLSDLETAQVTGFIISLKGS